MGVKLSHAMGAKTVMITTINQVLLGVPFGFQIDVWSLGVMLVEICVGKVSIMYYG